MLNDLVDSHAELDASFQTKGRARLPSSRSPILENAKVGWASPATLSLAEVQELCRTLVMLEAMTGILTKSAA